MNRTRTAWYSLACCLLLAITACNSNSVYDRYLPLPDREWHWKNNAAFEVQIEDTTRLYNVYVNLRADRDYEYSNLFVLLHTKSPAGDSTTRRLEFDLFEPDGRPTGKTSGTIYEHRRLALKDITFHQVGTYVFSIEQNMRTNTLKGLLDVGLSVEKGEEVF